MATIGKEIHHAARVLKSGGLVGMPTETVYGLAGNALNEQAIIEIYRIKNRPYFNPLILHIESKEKLKNLVLNIPPKAKILMDVCWPGPITLLLEKSSIIPDILTSGLRTVAVRIPNHPMAIELLKQLDFPLAAPSANPFGYVSPISAKHVNDQLGGLIPYILDGGSSSVGVESTIIGFKDQKPTIHRLGGINVEYIEELIGKIDVNVNVSSNPDAPGMLKAHYSTGKPMIVGDIENNLAKYGSQNTGIISFKKTYGIPPENLFILSKTGSMEESAQNIFVALRQMSRKGIDLILSEFLPEVGLGRAVNDRLRRAAGGTISLKPE